MKVLLAIDMSRSSDAEVEACIAQLPPHGTEVRVFHATNWETQLPLSYQLAEGPQAAKAVLAERDRILQGAEDDARRVADRLRAAGFTVSTDVRAEGDPRAAILDAAEHWPADLIMVGSHGRTGLDRLLLGSVSEGVVRHAPCSVEVVRPARQAAARRAPAAGSAA